jgi:LacI family transcriptional regulator
MVTTLNSYSPQERIKSYKNCIKKFKLEYDEEFIQPAANQFEALIRMLNKGVSAVVVCGEALGLPVSHTLRVMGKKAPEDLSVISLENETVSQYLYPPHTTIDMNFKEVAKVAVCKLQDLLEGNKKTQAIENIKAYLIERESVGEF